MCGIIWYYLSIRKWFHFNFELQMSILVNYRCQILWRLCRWGRHHLTPWRLFHHIKTRLNCFSHLNEELHHDFVSWWRPSKDDVNVHGNVEHKILLQCVVTYLLYKHFIHLCMHTSFHTLRPAFISKIHV